MDLKKSKRLKQTALRRQKRKRGQAKVTSKKVEFKRACAATATPFTAKDEVNIEEYKRHVEFMISNGINGLFPVGFVSGGLTLSPEEWRSVVKATVEQANGRVPVFPMCYVPG